MIVADLTEPLIEKTVPYFMPLPLLVMARRTVSSSGKSRIVGALAGERVDLEKYSEEQDTVGLV